MLSMWAAAVFELISTWQESCRRHRLRILISIKRSWVHRMVQAGIGGLWLGIQELHMAPLVGITLSPTSSQQCNSSITCAESVHTGKGTLGRRGGDGHTLQQPRGMGGPSLRNSIHGRGQAHGLSHFTCGVCWHAHSWRHDVTAATKRFTVQKRGSGACILRFSSVYRGSWE